MAPICAGRRASQRTNNSGMHHCTFGASFKSLTSWGLVRTVCFIPVGYDHCVRRKNVPACWLWARQWRLDFTEILGSKRDEIGERRVVSTRKTSHNPMSNHPQKHLALLRAIGVGLGIQLLAWPVAYAQQAAQPAAAGTVEPVKLEKTVVTGSLIPTAETVGPAPVAVVSAVELERRDVRAVEQLAKILPSAFGGGNFGSSRGNGGDGSASIALRGIPGGTLVLINGRRVAPNSFFDGSTVDLNTIPLAAVERIEILKDGGSAIYGADAVAGVVNFILKKNYNGSEFNAYYGNTTDSDVGTQNYSFVMGSSDEKSSFLVGGSYFKQNALFSKDRDRSRA